MKLVVVVACLVPLVAVSAAAQTPAQAAPAPATETKADAPAVKPKKICRYEAEIGSSIKRATCRTAADWALVDGRTSRAASGALALSPH